jgi:hypothetical protein
VYPYPTLVGQVDVRVRRASIDGRPVQLSLISQQEQVVALHQVGRNNWREGVLELEVALPSDELADGPWASVACVAVLTEGATNTRLVSRLVRDRGEKHWHGEVRVLRSMHFARATLEVNVVGSHGGVDGRIIGGADRPWYVDFRAREPVRRLEIDILEVDFRDDERAWLHPYKDAPWLVETSGDVPTVLLNTSFEGVADLLRNPRGRLGGATAGMVAAQIASDAWNAMFHSALAELELDEDGTPRLPGDWREPVLRAVLPDVFPGLPLSDALLEAHNRRNEERGWAELQPRVQLAAARRAAVPKNLVSVIRAAYRTQEGAEG